MLGNMIKAVFGSKNERELKRLEPVVAQINELEHLFNYGLQVSIKNQLICFMIDWVEECDKGF